MVGNCKKIYTGILFFVRGHSNKAYDLISLQRNPDFPISDHGHGNACAMCGWKRSTTKSDLGERKRCQVIHRLGSVLHS